jgi:acyl-coenzyme A synthetase/AMP-(fatty) acid ligase
MPPLNRRVATDAVGHLLPGFTARVVKSDGSIAGIGETGELYVTGPSCAIYYVNNEQM